MTFGVQRENLGDSRETLLAVNVITPPALPAGLPTPQDVDKINGTRIDTSIPVIGKLMGSYQFPFRLSVSGFYQFLAGSPFTRTVNAVSALGPEPESGQRRDSRRRTQRRQLRRRASRGPALELRPADRASEHIARARRLQRHQRQHGHAREFALGRRLQSRDGVRAAARRAVRREGPVLTPQCTLVEAGYSGAIRQFGVEAAVSERFGAVPPSHAQHAWPGPVGACIAAHRGWRNSCLFN